MTRKALILSTSILLLGPLFLAAQSMRDTVIQLHGRSVGIRYPQVKIHGVILMLPGWNFSKDKTCDNSSFCKKALEEGYLLICPEMGKSIYASAVFPETREDWRAYPQLAFITDTLQPFFQKEYKLLLKNGNNFVYGISTGARGAAIILENTTGIYKAGAMLSGDYDPVMEKTDNLMRGYYGPYEQFKERWEGLDNPAMHADKLRVPVYIGHGKADKVVPPAQSEVFVEILQKQKSTIVFSFKEKEGHFFAYWGSETDAVLAFFDAQSK
jgi:pimeloyl-ACP methyl ester carboxylesterase